MPKSTILFILSLTAGADKFTCLLISLIVILLFFSNIFSIFHLLSHSLILPHLLNNLTTSTFELVFIIYYNMCIIN